MKRVAIAVAVLLLAGCSSPSEKIAGQKNSAAIALMRYLKTDKAKSVMSAYGYSHPIK